jgi:hypothetical protein
MKNKYKDFEGFVTIALKLPKNNLNIKNII